MKKKTKNKKQKKKHLIISCVGSDFLNLLSLCTLKIEYFNKKRMKAEAVVGQYDPKTHLVKAKFI